jgi:hypothetical protein
MRLELGRGALEHGCHHAARAAPVRPEIDQQRDVTLLGVLRKSWPVKRERPALEERIAAGAAFAASIELLPRHPIGRVAPGTNHLRCLRHRNALLLEPRGMKPPRRAAPKTTCSLC